MPDDAHWSVLRASLEPCPGALQALGCARRDVERGRHGVGLHQRQFGVPLRSSTTLTDPGGDTVVPLAQASRTPNKPARKSATPTVKYNHHIGSSRGISCEGDVSGSSAGADGCQSVVRGSSTCSSTYPGTMGANVSPI